MKTQEAPILRENGVDYCRVKYPITEPPPEGMVPVRYHGLHKPTGTEWTDYVHLYDPAGIHRLVHHWNGYSPTGGDWVYWV